MGQLVGILAKMQELHTATDKNDLARVEKTLAYYVEACKANRPGSFYELQKAERERDEIVIRLYTTGELVFKE
jgi:hypothetical protein